MPIFPQRWTRTDATEYIHIISCQSSHRGGQEPVPQNIYTYNIMPIFPQRWTRTGATEYTHIISCQSSHSGGQTRTGATEYTQSSHRGGQEPVPQSWTITGATEVDKNRCHIIYTYNIMPIFPQRWTRTGATTYTHIISCQSSHRGGQEPVPQNIYTYNIMPIFPQRWTRTVPQHIHI